MKKIFYVLCFSTVTLLLNAQNYEKTVEPGKEWKITIPAGMGSINYSYYHIGCDTLIGNEVYYKVESRYYEEARGLVREDTIEQKVYYWSNDSIAERLVLDYQLVEGDVFDFGRGWEYKVDNVYYDDNGRKIISFDDIGSVILFIEGVGHSFKGIINHIKGWQYPSIHCILNICSSTSEEGDDLKVYPNPAKDLLHLTQKGVENKLMYTLADVSGIVWHKGTFTGCIELNVNKLKNGIYYLNLIDENQIEVKKILIHK